MRLTRLLPLLLLLTTSACDLVEPDADTGPVARAGAILDDNRRFHPIVLSAQNTGTILDALLGTAAGAVVAFAYDGVSRRFRQIPVQVDERHVYDVARAYGGETECPYNPLDGTYGVWCQNLTGHVNILGYSDPAQAAGPDPDTQLDADDEIALLLSDFGDQTTSHPAKVITSTRVEVEVSFGGTTGFAYLYKRQRSSVKPSAGVDYVTNATSFVNSSYNVVGIKPNGSNPPVPGHGASNPENTVVTGGWYSVRFGDRWIMNGLTLGERTNPSADLLEVDMLRFADDPGTTTVEGCQRTPYTGSQSEGGFLVNRDGPIRSIRRVIGFNSSPLMEMTWVFYPYTMHTSTTLRGHAFSGDAGGLMLFMDLSDAVTAHTYDSGAGSGTNVGWQTMSLPGIGGWAVSSDMETSLVFSPPQQLYYRSDATATNCRFDNNYHRAAHGIEIPFQAIPNTDPRNGAYGTLRVTRDIAFGLDPALALSALEENPVVIAR